ncbi:MAG: hypothetical protein WCJ68_00820 [Chitinophagia bacterium]
MYLIQDQNKETVAYIQNMMILDATQEHVIGILIGDCFFGKNNKVVGKIFNKTAYLLNGEIVGKIELNKNYKNTAIKKSLMAQAWDILMHVTEHTGAWIIETKKWSKLDLAQNLEA